MYLDFFRLKRHPFRITPDPSLFYAGGTHGRGVVLDALVYGITTGEGILKVVGEVGSGKTMLCRMLEERLPDSVEIVYLANPNLSARDIIYAIAFELRLEVEATTDRLVVMHRLQDYLLKRHSEGATVVVFIEEAQSMPLETLEEVRLLSNLETHRHKLMQIVLFGQPELDRKLAEKSIRQLKERITHSFYLDPLNEDEIRAYLHFRLQTAGCPWPQLFHPKAEKLLGKASGGLTRRINILADKSLLASYADPATRPELRNSAGEIQPMVLASHVQVAIADSGYGESWMPRLRQWLKYGAAVLAGILVSGGLMMGWQAFRQDATPVVAMQPAPAESTSVAVETRPVSTSPDNPVARQAAVPAESPVTETALQTVTATPREPETRYQEPAATAVAVTTTPVTTEAAQQVSNATPPEALQEPATDVAVGTPGSAVEPDESPTAADTGSGLAETPVIQPQPEPETPVPAAMATTSSTAGGTSNAKQESPLPVLPPREDRRPAVTTRAPEVPPLAALMLDRSRQWQESLASKTGYSIQMISIPVTETFTLQEYLEFMELSGMLEQTWLCLISGNARRKEQWLVFHNEFDGLSSARRYINSLPPYLSQHSPYARNLGDIACADP